MATSFSDALQLFVHYRLSRISAVNEGSIGFGVHHRNFEGTLAVLSDMMLNSTFPQMALDVVRGRTLVGLTQAKDQPTIVGAQVFAKILYGDMHPYGKGPTNLGKAITRDDVVAFQKAYFHQVARSSRL